MEPQIPCGSFLAPILWRSYGFAKSMLSRKGSKKRLTSLLGEISVTFLDDTKINKKVQQLNILLKRDTGIWKDNMTMARCLGLLEDHLAIYVQKDCMFGWI